jgi:hypothetical protein
MHVRTRINIHRDLANKYVKKPEVFNVERGNVEKKDGIAVAAAVGPSLSCILLRNHLGKT